MPPEKKNEFLDAGDSEDDQSQGYDSEADELQKGGRTAKRRRVEASDDEDEVENDAGLSDDGGPQDSDDADADEANQQDLDISTPSATEDPSKAKTSKSKSKPKDSTSTSTTTAGPSTLARKNLIASEAAIRRSGVVYLSRVPPYMKPQKLRTLLHPHGDLNRVFLAPEDPEAHTRRVRAGGNKKRLYTEGWVEFVSKRDAKRAVELLNARPLGGKKGSWYRDDVWNLRYLKGFKWHHLTEQIAGENAERASRVRAEVTRTNKENKEFARNVERSKVLEGIKASREEKSNKKDKGKGKRKRDGDGDGAPKTSNSVDERFALPGGDAQDEDVGAGGGRDRSMTFKQVPLAKKRQKVTSAIEKQKQPEHVTRVLSKIF